MRETPEIGVDLIKHFEGLHRVVTRAPVVTVTPYICPAGYWTIGYGHLCPKGHPDIGESDAAAYLRRDLRAAEQAVLSACPAMIGDNRPGRFAALVAFTFNVGSGAFKASTLRRMVNARDWDEAAAQFGRWVFGGGQKLPGLVARRDAERELFEAV